MHCTRPYSRPDVSACSPRRLSVEGSLDESAVLSPEGEPPAAWDEARGRLRDAPETPPRHFGDSLQGHSRDVSEAFPRHFRETPPRHSRGTPCVTPETRPRRRDAAPSFQGRGGEDIRTARRRAATRRPDQPASRRRRPRALHVLGRRARAAWGGGRRRGTGEGGRVRPRRERVAAMTDEDPGRVLTVLVVKKYYILDAKYTASKKLSRLSPEVCGGVRVVSGHRARLGTQWH